MGIKYLVYFLFVIGINSLAGHVGRGRRGRRFPWRPACRRARPTLTFSYNVTITYVQKQANLIFQSSYRLLSLSIAYFAPLHRLLYDQPSLYLRNTQIYISN